MKKNSIAFKISFILLSILFISYTIYNWTFKSSQSYNDLYTNQINFVKTLSTGTQVPEKNIQYKKATKFLIDPFLIDSTLYFTKMTYLGKFNSNKLSTIKKMLNYRESDSPREINIYDGYNNSGDSELTKNSKIIENDTVHLEATNHFSKSGKLLLHVSLDSIINYYDANDRIRKSISFERSYPKNKFNQLRSYDYDDFGNLTTYTLFYKNSENEKYLSKYVRFEYVLSNSGLNIKKTEYLKKYNKESFDKEIVHYSFDEEQKLRSKTRVFSISIGSAKQKVTEKYLFDYDKFGYLKSIIKEEVASPNKTEYHWLRDSLGRLILHKEKYYIRQYFYTNTDSIIYHSPYERTEYYIKNSNSPLPTASKNKIDRLYFYKEDNYGNTIFVKSVDELDPTNREKWMYNDYTLKYLPNHTWYYMKLVQSYPYPSKEYIEDAKENGFLKDDYNITFREFKFKSSIPNKKFQYFIDKEVENLKKKFETEYLDMN